VSGDDIRTVYFGQFEHATAERIAAALEEAGIAWRHKQAGGITQFFFAGEWGVRMYVDGARLDEAKQVARRALEQPAGEANED